MVNKMKLPEIGIFVFGSNLAGRHGAGAALYARRCLGAELGVGEGPTGRCYALPTVDALLDPLPLSEIVNHVGKFFDYAIKNPDLMFYVTRVGTGLAGYSDSDIAKLFRDPPDNCRFDAEWTKFIPCRIFGKPDTMIVA